MIGFSNVSKRYGNNVGADSVSLDISKGSVFGLLGSNGAGKTTIIKMLVGLLAPDSGSITVEGINVRSDPVAVKRLFGYKPEAPFLYERLTAREYLHFTAKVRKAVGQDGRIAHLLDLFNLSERADDTIATYSFGMRSKVSLCSAFVGTPQIVILDEPTNGLDPMSVYNLKELLSEFSADGGTVLVSSHILDFVEKVCTCFGIIAEGKLKAVTKRDDLKVDNESLEDFFMRCLRGEDRQLPTAH